MLKLYELLEEFRAVLGARLLDLLLPPAVFLITNSLWGLNAAMASALALALALGAWRLRHGQPLRYALGGAGGVLLALALVWALGKAEGYFLPGLITGALTVALSLLSLLTRRPLTAWSSFLARRWPLDWYWHPRVRPAYSETTLLWAVFFAARLWWQVTLYTNAQVAALAWVQTLSGWPALILLLVLTYLYGTWRLRSLRGPSVEEFKNHTPPPWQGQQRGF